jgi:hypothetical protein
LDNRAIADYQIVLSRKLSFSIDRCGQSCQPPLHPQPFGNIGGCSTWPRAVAHVERDFARGIPELRLTGHGGGPKDLRGTSRRRNRGLVRPERAAWRGRVGSTNQTADPRLSTVHADCLGRHGSANRGLFQARMEAGGRPDTRFVRTGRISCPSSHRLDTRSESRCSGRIPARPMDTAAGWKRISHLRGADPAAHNAGSRVCTACCHDAS